MKNIFNYKKEVIEKIWVGCLKKLEASISAIEESCDLQALTIAQLTNFIRKSKWCQ